jgi:hypothetical protein
MEFIMKTNRRIIRAINLSLNLIINNIPLLFRGKSIKDARQREIIKALKKDGFYHYQGFFDYKEVANINEMIDIYLANNEEKLRETFEIFECNFSINAMRWSGLDRHISHIYEKYKNNPFILACSNSYYDYFSPVTKCTYDLKKWGGNPETCSLDDRIENTIFYHLDWPYKVLKTHLLLKDAREQDGPFKIVKGSHKYLYGNLAQILRKLKMYFHLFWGVRKNATYITEPKNEKFFFDHKDVFSCTGKAGDLFFIDTSAYHQGGEIQKKGCRKVLWNYMYPEFTVRRLMTKMIHYLRK